MMSLVGYSTVSNFDDHYELRIADRFGTYVIITEKLPEAQYGESYSTAGYPATDLLPAIFVCTHSLDAAKRAHEITCFWARYALRATFAQLALTTSVIDGELQLPGEFDDDEYGWRDVDEDDWHNQPLNRQQRNARMLNYALEAYQEMHDYINNTRFEIT